MLKINGKAVSYKFCPGRKEVFIMAEIISNQLGFVAFLIVPINSSEPSWQCQENFSRCYGPDKWTKCKCHDKLSK